MVVTRRLSPGASSIFGRLRLLRAAPCNVSSGEKQSTSGLIQSGNRILRKTLIEAAHRLARHEARWRTFHQHLVEEKHKPKCVAAAAIANRWMRCLFHEMKTPLAVAA